MKRQIIKTRPQGPYIVARAVVIVVAVALAVFAVYELSARAGLHFH
jgi:thiol:disulfide interchange protein